MASGGWSVKCSRCDHEYNREERCPRTLMCGHTSCTSCLEVLIKQDERRCPTCSRKFFSLSTVLIPKNSEILSSLGESTKPSSKTPLRSSLSADSRLERTTASRGKSSALSTLGFSPSLGSSFKVGGALRARNEGDYEGVSISSTGGSLPPPLPSSEPPSLVETSSDLQVSSIKTTGAPGVEGEGSDGGAGARGAPRLSPLHRSSSADQASRGSYTPLTYAFPTIRTKLNINNSSRRTDIESSSSGGKGELRPAKSMSPISSSTSSSSSQSMLSSSSSSAFRSLPPLSSSLSPKMESPPSSSVGYTSPFSKASSSSFSSFRRNTFRILSSTKDPALQTSTPSDSLSKRKEGNGVTPSALSDSVDSSGLSRSLPSFSKLESNLSVPLSAKKRDEADLGISKWKLATTSLSRKTDVNGAASRRTDGQNAASRRADGQNAAASSPARPSGTPTHVLRMCRTITSKSRPATDDAADAMTHTGNSNARFLSYRKAVSSSSSSSSSSSTTTSKNTQGRQESSQFGQEAKALRENRDSGRREAAPEMPIDGAPSSGGWNDGLNSSSFDSDGSTGDASERRPSPGAGVGMNARGGEVEDPGRHSPPASPPSERRGKESKETRKLALSTSFSARLGARTRFLATAIDEVSEEEDEGIGMSSAGVNQDRTGSAGKLCKPDRQGVQPTRPHGSLGSSISARVSYLSGGRGGEEREASRSVVQAEDSTKIDQQRRTGRAWTKRDAAAGGLHRTLSVKEDGAAGIPTIHLGPPEGGDERDAKAKLMQSPPCPVVPESSRRTPGVLPGTEATGNKKNVTPDSRTEEDDTGSRAGHNRITFQSKIISAEIEDSEGDGASGGAFYSGQRGSRGVWVPHSVSANEVSQHSRWRRYRAIDSNAKEELADPGCGPQVASTQGVGNTSGDAPEATAGKASRALSHADSASSEDDAWRTKHIEESEGTPPFSRSEAGSANGICDTMDGSLDNPRGVLARQSSPAPPQSSSDPFPWRKKWRNVTARTSSAAARHTRPEVKNTPLSEASKQPEQPTPIPRSLAAQGEAEGEAGTWRERSSGTLLHSRAAAATTAEGLISPSYRGALGALAIGRVSSVQESEVDGTVTQKVRQGAARTDEGHAGEHTLSEGPEARGQGGGSHTEGSTRDARSTVAQNAALSLRGDDGAARLKSSGGYGGKHANWIPDTVRQIRTVPQGAAEHTARPQQPARGAAEEETQEDINTRLHRARQRLLATATTPTVENEPAAPARTNLAYLLARVQGTESKRTTRADEDEDEEEDEVFDEDSEDEREANTHQHSLSSGGRSSVNSPVDSEAPTKSTQGDGKGQAFTTNEPDSLTRRLPPRREQGGRRDGGKTTPTGRQEENESEGSDEDCTDAPYEGPSEDMMEEYEPGVGLCSSHGLMLHLYCEDCEEWVCNDCLRVLHRPRPQGPCRVISAAEGVTQMKVSHASFLTSRTNTLEYFRAELQRITEQCDSSIRLHKDKLRRLEEKTEEEQRLLRGIESMRALGKEKQRQVDYWENVLQENLSRIDKSSSSQDVLRAVQESSGEILQKAMEAVSLEASGGVLLSPPN